MIDSRNLTPPPVVAEASDEPSRPSFRREGAAAIALLALTGMNVALAAPSSAAGAAAPQPASAASGPAAAPLKASHVTSKAAPLWGNHKVFFGNLHSHTSYSDGSGTPEEAFQHARAVGLDFMAVTEHNHAQADGSGDRNDGILIANDPALYDGDGAESLVSAATRATTDGKFVALYGQEFSTISSGNHVNVFDVQGVIDAPNGDFRALLRSWLPHHLDSTGTLALLQLNHPESGGEQPKEYGRDDFADKAEWIRTLDAQAELIEVFNGPGLKDEEGLSPSVTSAQYLRYLNLGFHLGPTGDQDNHYKNWGSLTDARTGIIAPALTKLEVLRALKSRHTYASTDRNLRFLAKAIVRDEEHLMGDIIAPPPAGTDFEIRYVLKDADESDATYKFDVFSDVIGGSEVAVQVLPEARTGDTDDGQPGRIQGLTYDGERRYYLIKVTQTNDDGERDTLWTAPVWFEPPNAPAGASGDGDDLAAFVASRNSGVFHVSSDCRFAKKIKPENRVKGAAATEGRAPHEGCPVE